MVYYILNEGSLEFYDRLAEISHKRLLVGPERARFSKKAFSQIHHQICKKSFGKDQVNSVQFNLFFVLP